MFSSAERALVRVVMLVGLIESGGIIRAVLFSSVCNV